MFKTAKNASSRKKIFIWFHEFFAWTFLNFLAHCEIVGLVHIKNSQYRVVYYPDHLIIFSFLFSLYTLVHDVIKAAFQEKPAINRLLGKDSKRGIFTRNYSIETTHFHLKKNDLKKAAFFHAIGKVTKLI